MERLGEWSFRGYLPHFNAAPTCQLITFRLADALPSEVNEKLVELTQNTPEARQKIEAYLDKGYGSGLLQKSKNAKLVKDALLHFHRVRYYLHAWVIMPNHVHVLIEPFVGYPVGKIVGSWKGFTAYEMGKREAVYREENSSIWQPDYFDRYIRDAAHHEAARNYIIENPVKAGLVKVASKWRWSSAYVGNTQAFRLP